MKSFKLSMLLSFLYLLLIFVHMDSSRVAPSLLGMVIFLVCLGGTLVKSLRISMLLAFLYTLAALAHLDSPMVIPEEVASNDQEALVTYYRSLDKHVE